MFLKEEADRYSQDEDEEEEEEDEDESANTSMSSTPTSPSQPLLLMAAVYVLTFVNLSHSRTVQF